MLSFPGPMPASQEQFTAAYDEYADAIYRHCYYRVSDKEQAEELMHDTFLRAWDFAQKGAEIENMRAFLYKIANNLIINWYKKKKSDSLDAMMEAGFDVATDDMTAEEMDRERTLRTLLNALDPENRQMLVMRYIDELGTSEIAKIMDLSENAVSARLSRAIKKLRSLEADV